MANLPTNNNMDLEVGAAEKGTHSKIMDETNNNATAGLIIAWINANVGGANMNAREWARTYQNILFKVADVGSSLNIDWSSHNVTIRKGGANAVNSMEPIVTQIRLNGTVRAWHRANAHIVYRQAKQKRIIFNVGAQQGISSEYGYLGFDTADALLEKQSLLSVEERATIDSMKQVGLFRATREKLLNTSQQVTGGRSVQGGGNPQSNAGQIGWR